jgi:hypothetical protein
MDMRTTVGYAAQELKINWDPRHRHRDLNAAQREWGCVQHCYRMCEEKHSDCESHLCRPQCAVEFTTQPGVGPATIPAATCS